MRVAEEVVIKMSYNCSKHGNIGDPDCEECRENLRKLCTDKNTLLVNERGEIEN